MDMTTNSPKGQGVAGGRSDARETEWRLDRYAGLESWAVGEALGALQEGQMRAVAALLPAMDQLTAAVTAAMEALRGGKGRLVYAGAGTSGRLALLDGTELGPTFGWPDERLVLLLAGGEAAAARAEEDAEDDEDAGREGIAKHHIGAGDVVLGVAASGTTRYTRALIMAAREAGATTIGFANNPGAPLLTDAEYGVLLRTGPEVLAGSTRLGAGTAQKAALNMFSTALMIGLKKVHLGYMVDMLPNNEKLRQRAAGMVADIAGCDPAAARAALARSGDRIKPAVMIAAGAELAEAEALLGQAEDDLGAALAAFRAAR